MSEPRYLQRLVRPALAVSVDDALHHAAGLEEVADCFSDRAIVALAAEVNRQRQFLRAANSMYVALQKCRNGIGRETNYLSGYSERVSGLREAIAEYEAALAQPNAQGEAQPPATKL